ncbi:MAG: ArsR family transcriptional regulator [Anaerolineae bacterium]|nr:ArsR family transcriptional regulator [Anaerolineae bacterium]
MQSTRQEMLNILHEEKQATVEDLAERLELTPMTIRHHLNVLQAQNLVVANKVRRSRRVGRPRLVYTLTDAADDLFPHGYGELARHLLAEVKELVSGDETDAIFRRMAERIASEAPPREEGQSFQDRLEQVSAFLEEQGFLSRWEETDEGYMLTNVNCPYRQVSRQHDEVCILDTELIRTLLDVEPRRLTSMRQGDATCSFLLVPHDETGKTN